MKGKFNLKTIIIFTILILVIVLLILGVNVAKTFMSGATADYEPQNLTAIPKEDGKTATVSWTSDKEAKASIFYGTNMASLLLMAEDMEPVVDHNILLTNLRSNTTYYYKIVVDSENIFDNGGVMYNFKTGGVDNAAIQSIPTPTIVLMPTMATSSTSSSACSRDNMNSIQYNECVKNGGTATTSATPTTIQDKCAIGGTYNNGLPINNSMDRSKCLQGP